MDEKIWSATERPEIEHYLEHILASQSLASSKHLQDIFRYLVEQTLAGRAGQITQTSIAIDVLGRDERFDPSLDSLVRVEMSRLRTKLREYYYEEGVEDRIKFEFPKGRYIPHISITQTPEPQTDVTDTSAETPIRNRRSPYPILLVGLSAVLLLAMVLYRYLPQEDATIRDETAGQASPEQALAPVEIPLSKSVAVLPFDNRSENAEDAYFTDGLHDDLLTQLTKIRDLKVIARSSVMHYRDTNTPLPKIAKDLGVDTILVGSVNRSGDRIRIHVQFIDARTEEYLWAESFDRKLTTANIFDIQRDISTRTAETLQSTVTPEEQQQLAVVPTDNLAAYEAYLLGKQRMATRTSTGLAEAVENFNKAISIDPRFSLAYTGLADSYVLQFNYDNNKGEEVLRLAETSINQALDLDKDSGEAYTSLGILNILKEEYDAAEWSFKQGINLNPNYAWGHYWYGEFLFRRDRKEEALEEIRTSLKLDPLSANKNIKMGEILQWLGKMDEARTYYEKGINMDPDLWGGYSALAGFFWSLDQLDNAVINYKKSFTLNPRSHPARGNAELYYELGDLDQAECWAKIALDYDPENTEIYGVMLRILSARGEEKAALGLAEKTLTQDAGNLYALAYLRDQDLRNGSYDKAWERYTAAYPDLKDKEYIMVGWDFETALEVVPVLQASGESARANRILEQSLTSLGSFPKGGHDGYRLEDVKLYALRGETEKALAALRQSIDMDMYVGWRELVDDSMLKPINNKPRFLAMLEAIKARRLIQLKRVEEMKEEGDPCVNP